MLSSSLAGRRRTREPAREPARELYTIMEFGLKTEMRHRAVIHADLTAYNCSAKFCKTAGCEFQTV